MKHFPTGWSFNIADCSKQHDGDWWTWTLFDCNGAVVKQCEWWWGFDTMNDALNNLAENSQLSEQLRMV